MKNKIYKDMPVGKLVRIPDFLPPPHELAKVKIHIKVTLSLTKESLDFFQDYAKRNKVKYQKMIRELLDIYAKQAQALDKKK